MLEGKKKEFIPIESLCVPNGSIFYLYVPYVIYVTNYR